MGKRKVVVPPPVEAVRVEVIDRLKKAWYIQVVEEDSEVGPTQ
jgi:hypothetical protein